MPLPHSCATVFAHFGLLCVLCYPIESFHPTSRTKVSPEWSHYATLPPCAGASALYTPALLRFLLTHGYFCNLIIETVCYFDTSHVFCYIAVHGIAQHRRKFAKFCSLMESSGFTFRTYCQRLLSINMSKFSCKFLRGSGANPFLKSYTTILQWSLDGYNTFGKIFLK